MSEVNASDMRLVNGPEDVIDTYKGAGEDSRTGIEVELAFFDPKSTDLTPMSVAQNKALKNAANAARGEEYVRNEPTSEMLEIGSFAGKRNDIKEILADTQEKILQLTQKAADMGLKRSYFQHLPDKTAEDLLKNVMDVPRYQAFFAPPRDDMRSIAAYFSVCKSNQVSISYRNPQHLIENVRRLYVLSPFLFTLLDNAAPFNEGHPFTGNAGMHHRAALKDRGGVPPYLFTAQTGEAYITAHIDHAMNNPLFVYYDEQGKLVRLPSGTWTSFNALREKGLNTATNYFFAESILWPDVKIAALKDKNGQVNGHRYEARMFGVGIHQHQSAQLITAAPAFDKEFASKIDALLKRAGFDLQTPESLKAPLEKAYQSARNHNGHFLDIPYGNTSMQAFAKDFADLLEQSTLMQNFEEEIQPLLTICRTGYTDSKVNAHLFNTMDKALKFQREYDPAIFENPNACAYTLFENVLNREYTQMSANCSGL